eukprot:421707_1
MAESKPKKNNEMSEERKQEVLSKFKRILINAARKERLRKLIETKRREQGIDVKEQSTDSPFVPCSDNCIEKFLEITQPNKNDIIVDLGCGDGRVLIAAAKYAKCKCIGIEIQPLVANKARDNVTKNNLNNLIEIIECDFKSLKCNQILQKATIVFLFLLPKIMPLVTNILSNNVSNGCKVASYIFDLAKIKKDKINKYENIIEINKWSYPTLGCTELKYINGKVFLNNLHPILKNKIGMKDKNCEYILLQVNEKIIDNDVNNLYEFVVFKRYLHNILSDCYQYKYRNDGGYSVKIVIEFRQVDDYENNDLENAKPNMVMEVAKKFRNGSEIRSDLKLYEFPLNDSEFGWVNPNGASRIVHAK